MKPLERLEGRIRHRLAGSGRLMAIRLLVESSKGWTAVLSIWVAASAALPILTLVALGVVVGRVPGAARFGLGSPDGHRLVTALVIAGA